VSQALIYRINRSSGSWRSDGRGNELGFVVGNTRSWCSDAANGGSSAIYCRSYVFWQNWRRPRLGKLSIPPFQWIFGALVHKRVLVALVSTFLISYAWFRRIRVSWWSGRQRCLVVVGLVCTPLKEFSLSEWINWISNTFQHYESLWGQNLSFYYCA